jgi:two-component system nitrogen regulation sensor histidine kinase GlnL
MPCTLDRTRFEQVILNLIVNALEELKQGGTLAITARDQDNRVTVEVRDSGRGIPDNIRTHIFDPYFTTKSQGSGMGLAYCDKIIRQHGGQIDVETGPEGTCFRITLPPQPHEA